MSWLEALPPWVAALPWLIGPLLVFVRWLDSRDLRDYQPARDTDAPRVSIIVPARNEALNIERCVRSLLAATYPNFELIVLDDHSTDATGDLARRAAAGDARVIVSTPPPLPAGWFGKQWACAHGASLATGELLLFTDADTAHGPELLARSVTALRERKCDVLSVVGHQELGSFWEYVVQPTIFLGIFTAFGGTETISRTREPKKKILNGQYLLCRRDVYDALGGHEAVRSYVAEDLMIAQTWTAAGRTVHMIGTRDQLSVRMYRSLDEIIRGWGKNAWSGGKHMIGDHPVRLMLARIIMPLLPWNGVLPVIAAVLGLAGIASPWWTAFGIWAYAFQTVVWIAVYAHSRLRPAFALLYPLGCVMASYIYVRAAIRGDRTEWKGREYSAA